MDDRPPIPEQSERGPPSHFAGREAELTLMRRRLDVALTDPKAAMRGMLLLTGVPGIGKTFLLDHFATHAAGNKRVRVLPLNPTHLTSAEGLLALIGEALGDKGKFARRAGVDDKITGVRAGVPGVLTAGVNLDGHRPSLDFVHMLQATSGLRASRNKALIVTIDEVQSMDARSAPQMQALHFGQHGCPILTIAAGLQHSQSVLSDFGVSRMTSHRMKPLSGAESHQAIYHGLRKLGVAVAEDVAERFAAASMGFPQHIQMHIDAARRIHNEGRDVNAPKAVDDVLGMGRQAREDYYSGRLMAMRGGAEKLVPLVECMVEREADAIAYDEAESMVGSEVLNAAVQRGVLTQDELGLLSFGIPSFRTYMIRQVQRFRATTAAKPA